MSAAVSPPQSQSGVSEVVAPGQDAPIRQDEHIMHTICVATQRPSIRSAVGPPQSQCGIVAPGQDAAIRHDADTADGLCVPPQWADIRRAIGPPESQCGIVAPGQDAAISHDANTADGLCVPPQWVAIGRAIGPPQPQGGVDCGHSVLVVFNNAFATEGRIPRTPRQDAAIGHDKSIEHTSRMSL